MHKKLIISFTIVLYSFYSNPSANNYTHNPYAGNVFGHAIEKPNQATTNDTDRRPIAFTFEIDPDNLSTPTDTTQAITTTTLYIDLNNLTTSAMTTEQPNQTTANSTYLKATGYKSMKPNKTMKDYIRMLLEEGCTCPTIVKENKQLVIQYINRYGAPATFYPKSWKLYELLTEEAYCSQSITSDRVHRR